MEGIKTSQPYAQGGSKMFGGLLLLALTDITTATDKNYCLRMKTEDEGFMEVKIKFDGGTIGYTNSGRFPVGWSPVNECFDRKISYVTVKGIREIAWKGTVEYQSTGAAGISQKTCIVSSAKTSKQ
mmetsp:Transcript_1062/g.1984  ORF Transcript_1062/g.1984 Transcript_1062/m.1984 type:complete len:126 (-) Transcript_1062:454-831(-)